MRQRMRPPGVSASAPTAVLERSRLGPQVYTLTDAHKLTKRAHGSPPSTRPRCGCSVERPSWTEGGATTEPWAPCQRGAIPGRQDGGRRRERPAGLQGRPVIQSPRKAASERGHTLFFLSELGVGAWGPHTSVDSSTQRPDLASPLPARVPVDDSTAPVGKRRGFAPSVARSETSHQPAHLSILEEAPVSS